MNTVKIKLDIIIDKVKFCKDIELELKDSELNDPNIKNNVKDFILSSKLTELFNIDELLIDVKPMVVKKNKIQVDYDILLNIDGDYFTQCKNKTIEIEDQYLSNEEYIITKLYNEELINHPIYGSKDLKMIIDIITLKKIE